MTGSLPFNFGEYSPRTLGVTINLPVELGGRLKEILPYLLADTAEEHLQGLTTLVQQAANDDERFVVLGYASAFYHELRHFHDYLLSPVGSLDATDFIMAAANLLPAQIVLRSEEAIVIPLQAWEALSDRIYAIFNRHGNGTLRRHPPELSRGYTDAVDKRFKALEARQNLSADLPDGPLTTAHIVEASALNVQAAYLLLNYGAAAWPLFRDGLKRADRTGDYTRVSRLWDRSFAWRPPGANLSYGVLNAILFCSLCGFPDEEYPDLQDDPPHRLVSILEYLENRREVPTDASIIQILDDWAKQANKLSFQDALTIALHGHRQYLAGLFAEMSSLEQTLGVPIYSGTRELFTAMADAREHMVKEFLREPLTYLDPVLYLRNRDRFVACPLYLSTTSALFDRDGELMTLMRAKGWTAVAGRRSADGQRSIHQLLRAPSLTAGRTFLDRKQSWDLSSTFWLTHVLWSRNMAGAIEREVAALALRDHLPNTKILSI